MKKIILSLSSLMLIIFFYTNLTMALTYSDSFEGSSFDPFWEVTITGTATASLSSDIAHSGSQSFKAECITSSNYTGSNISHDFSQSMTGDLSVWLYDGYPGTSGATYALMRVYNEVDFNLGYIQFGVFDNEPDFYWLYAYDNTWVKTSIQRTQDWHKLSVIMNENQTICSIDDVTVYSSMGPSSFTKTEIFTTSLPHYTGLTYYFDDFNCDCNPVPEPSSIVLLVFGMLGLISIGKKRKKF